PLGVLGRVPHPDVEHDLHELRNLVRVLQVELLRQLGSHLLRVVLVQPRRRRGLGGRALGLGRRRLLSLGGLLPLLFVFLLVFLFVLLFWLRLRRPLAPGRGPAVGGGGPALSLLLRFLLFIVGHAISLSRAESAGRTSPRSAPPFHPCPGAAAPASALPTWGRA